MDFKKIEQIVTIAEEGTVSSAAKRLFISQSALSQSLINLEEDLGVQLFKRINKKMILSYAGENYIKASKEILEIKRKTYKLINDVSNNKKGRFTVGITSKRGIEMYSNIYAKFHHRYPDVIINVKESGAKNLESLVKNNNVDIGTVSTKKYIEEINYEKVDSEEVFLIIPASHPLSSLNKLCVEGKYGKISMKNLHLFKDENFIATTKETGLRVLTDKIFDKAGIIPNIIFETSSASPIRHLVKNGIGVGFDSNKIIHEIDDIILLSLIPRNIRFLWVAYRKDNYLTEPERYFIKLIKEYYENK